MSEKIEKIIVDLLIELNDELEGNPLDNPTKKQNFMKGMALWIV